MSCDTFPVNITTGTASRFNIYEVVLTNFEPLVSH
jgi:hypothetical protein